MNVRLSHVVLGLAIAMAGAAGRAVGQDLTLVVDPRTGQTSIRNVTSSGLAIDGYLLGSPSGGFKLAGWNSLEGAGTPGWREGNPTAVHVSETNLFSSTTIGPAAGPAASLGLGSLYTPFAPTQIGQLEPTVTFEYHLAGGGSVVGDVLFAPQNNLVLVVDAATGDASIQNQSNFNVNIDGYIISSPAGALAPSGWTSFIDSGVAGWSEGNPGAKHLSEVNLFGSRMFAANGAPVSIGAAVNAAVLTDQTDLTFEYHIADGATVRGGVAFKLPSAVQQGDFDGNGRVDGNDFLRWQRGLGVDFDADDLVAWRNNYGAGGAVAASVLSAHAVPEPNAAAISALAALLGAVVARRAQRSS